MAQSIKKEGKIYIPSSLYVTTKPTKFDIKGQISSFAEINLTPSSGSGDNIYTADGSIPAATTRTITSDLAAGSKIEFVSTSGTYTAKLATPSDFVSLIPADQLFVGETINDSAYPNILGFNGVGVLNGGGVYIGSLLSNDFSETSFMFFGRDDNNDNHLQFSLDNTYGSGDSAPAIRMRISNDITGTVDRPLFEIRNQRMTTANDIGFFSMVAQDFDGSSYPAGITLGYLSDSTIPGLTGAGNYMRLLQTSLQLEQRDAGTNFTNLTLGTRDAILTGTRSATLSASNDINESTISVSPDRIQFTTVTGIIQILNLPTYADQAAALLGGLETYEIYQTATGELRIVV